MHFSIHYMTCLVWRLLFLNQKKHTTGNCPLAAQILNIDPSIMGGSRVQSVRLGSIPLTEMLCVL